MKFLLLTLAVVVYQVNGQSWGGNGLFGNNGFNPLRPSTWFGFGPGSGFFGQQGQQGPQGFQQGFQLPNPFFNPFSNSFWQMFNGRPQKPTYGEYTPQQPESQPQPPAVGDLGDFHSPELSIDGEDEEGTMQILPYYPPEEEDFENQPQISPEGPFEDEEEGTMQILPYYPSEGEDYENQPQISPEGPFEDEGIWEEEEEVREEEEEIWDEEEEYPEYPIQISPEGPVVEEVAVVEPVEEIAVEPEEEVVVVVVEETNDENQVEPEEEVIVVVPEEEVIVVAPEEEVVVVVPHDIDDESETVGLQAPLL